MEIITCDKAIPKTRPVWLGLACSDLVAATGICVALTHSYVLFAESGHDAAQDAVRRRVDVAYLALQADRPARRAARGHPRAPAETRRQVRVVFLFPGLKENNCDNHRACRNYPNARRIASAHKTPLFLAHYWDTHWFNEKFPLCKTRPYILGAKKGASFTRVYNYSSISIIAGAFFSKFPLAWIAKLCNKVNLQIVGSEERLN